MKRIILVCAILVLMVGNVFATSSMVPSVYTNSTNMVTIKVVCTSSDGTFATTQLTSASSQIGFRYWEKGYYLLHAFAVNDHTTYAASGAVTITTSTGSQLVGTASGDTLTLSTSADGLASLSASRGPVQRPVIGSGENGGVSVAVSSTGQAAIFTLYLVLGK